MRRGSRGPGASRRRRGGRAAFPCAGLIALLLLIACDAPGSKLRVVLVTVDTVRYDDFAGGQAEGTPMPRTRAHARRGTDFTRAYASSNVTQPTHASLFTSLHPWEHGVTDNGMILEDRFETLAESLRAEGFATAAVVASFPLGTRFGFAQGFDVYREVFDRELIEGMRTWEGVEVPAGAFYSLADAVVGQALEVLDAVASRRQFFWFHFFDPHDPYGDSVGAPLDLAALYAARNAGGEALRDVAARARRLYREDLASLDAALGRLLDRLERDAGRIETHVIVTADHGESFGEGGHVGHGESLAPEEIQVPLFIVSPRLPPGSRADVASSVDIRPTLFALAGIEGPGGRGRDLRAVANGTAGEALGMRRSYRRVVAAQGAVGALAQLSRERFFLARGGAVYAGHGGEVQRLDRGGPPGSIPSQGDLRALFGHLERRVGATPLPALDEETARALRALGYGS